MSQKPTTKSQIKIMKEQTCLLFKKFEQLQEKGHLEEKKELEKQ